MLSVESECRPFVHGLGAEGAVEVEAWGVPFEAGPFDPSPVVLDGELCESSEEGLAESAMTIGCADIEVFEIDAGACEPGGEVVEPEGDACRDAVGLGDEHLGGRLVEEMSAEEFLGGMILFGGLLVFGKLMDAESDEGNVVRNGKADGVHKAKKVTRVTRVTKKKKK